MYRLKITLDGIRPPVWRRILVPDISLAELHEVFQAAMGWRNSHLYLFDIEDEQFSDSVTAAEVGMQVADRVKLSARGLKKGAKFSYVYDFGDRWEHDVRVEEVHQGDREEGFLCLAGRRACPPEDVGSVPGYENLLEALRDPRHPDRGEFKRWLRVIGYGAFDPEAFDVEAVNKAMQRLPTGQR